MRQLKIRRLIFGVSIVVLVISVAFIVFGDKKSALFLIASFISLLFPLTETGIVVWDRFIRDAETRQRQPILANQRSDRAYLDGRIKEFEDEHRLEKWFVSPQASTVERMVDTTYSSDGRPLKNIEEAVTIYDRRFMLLGEPGAGKSTTLRYLMKQAIIAYQRDPAANRLPVWVNLGLSGTPIDAEELLNDLWQRTSLESTPWERIENRNLWLFMDGLNEMLLGSREKRANSLRTFLKKYPHLPVIVACRVRDYADDPTIQLDLPDVTVHELDDTRIQEFLHKRGAKPGLWERICENGALRRWAANPLKLEMMIAVYNHDKAMPESLDQLYGYYVEEAYHRFKDERKNQANIPMLKLEWTDLESRLKRLAFRMIADGKGTAAEIGWVREKIGNVALRDGLSLGVLIREGNAIKFYHQSLHGFFAVDNLDQFLRSEGKSKSQIESILALIRQLGDLEDAGAPAVPALVHVLKDPDWNVRSYATFALGQIGDPRAVDPLIATLADSKEDVRCYAASALGQLGDTTALNPLIATLADPSKSVRSYAANALGQLGDPRAIVPLVTTLTDPKGSVRDSVAYALSHIGTPAVDPLIAALTDPDSDVRSYAADALSQIGDPRAVDPLIAALADPDWNVRSWAADALGKIAKPAVTPLVTTLADPDESVCYWATNALAKIGEPAVDPLITALTDPNEDVRYWAADALGKIGEPAVNSLITALADSNVDVRYWAAYALGQLGSSDALGPLISTLADPNDDVRGNVAAALGEIGYSYAVDPLISTLADPNDDVRSRAAAALGQIGHSRALEPLIHALTDPDSSVRSSAAYALAELSDPTIFEPLIHALTDPDSSVRSSAASALGRTSDSRALEPLIVALTDPDSSVRSSTAYALGELGDHTALEPLIVALADPDSSVRRNTAYALSQLNDYSHAVDPLIALLADPDGSVCRTAASSLGRIGTPEALQAVEKWQEEEKRQREVE